MHTYTFHTLYVFTIKIKDMEIFVINEKQSYVYFKVRVRMKKQPRMPKMVPKRKKNRKRRNLARKTSNSKKNSIYA